MRISQLGRRLGHVWRDLVFHDKRGVLTFELAWIVAALSTISVAIIDLSLAYSRKADMTNAVRAGSQFALVRRPTLGPEATAEEALISLSELRAVVVNSANYLEADPGSQDLDIAVFCECPDTTPVQCNSDPGVPLPCADAVTLLTVTLKGAYTPILPYPGLPDSFDLETSNTIRLN
jgi:Flp pilus assembly protein TadG